MTISDLIHKNSITATNERYEGAKKIVADYFTWMPRKIQNIANDGGTWEDIREQKIADETVSAILLLFPNAGVINGLSSSDHHGSDLSAATNAWNTLQAWADSNGLVITLGLSVNTKWQKTLTLNIAPKNN